MKADDSRITRFVERLNALDPGNRARLKRHAGKTLDEAPKVLTLFYRLLPESVEPYHEAPFFLVATLFPLAVATEKGNLGDALRALRNDDNAAGLDRRFEILLDADAQQLPYRLRQMVRMLAAQGYPVPWAQLLADLTVWEHPARPVQRAWARRYFHAPHTQ